MGGWARAASIASLPGDVTDALAAWRDARRANILSALSVTDITAADITRDELLRAVKQGQSTAPGEDGVTYDILNCLAAIENSPLLHLFNMSYREGRLPRAWKKAIIVPVPKSNGEKRPISLTSCFSKMMERIILERLLFVIGDQIKSNMFGFMKGKGTTDAIIRCLTSHADYCRVFIDLKGAFDTANGEVIMHELASMGVGGRLLHWLGSYLFGRRAQVWYQGALSQEAALQLGTPQGSVLSPLLFNVLMNKLASEHLEGAETIVYADDILVQSKKFENMQGVLDKIGTLLKRMGLVINESKTKFQCRSASEKILSINGKQIERVRSHKYLGVYVGYNADSKEAELNHLLTQCRARLRPMRSLAWSGRGVGAPVLRSVYLATVRPLIDYASPVLSCFGEGRISKLEKLQNQAMRIILNCPLNAMNSAMRVETALPSVKQRVDEVNLAAAVRHMRHDGGEDLLRDVREGLVEGTAAVRRSRKGYIEGLLRNITKYELTDQCRCESLPKMPPPWEQKDIKVVISGTKKDLTSRELKTKTEKTINELGSENTAQVYCDGSVAENGRAGCGIVIREISSGTYVDHEESVRISDGVSSTQAELQAILYALQLLRGGTGDVCFFVDSQSALQALNSTAPALPLAVAQCKLAVHHLTVQGRSVTFTWVPAHVGVQGNERADELAKLGTEKENVEIKCVLTMRQIKAKIRLIQGEEETARFRTECDNSATLRHYAEVVRHTDFVYGRQGSAWKDSLCTRLRLGYKYLWEVGAARAEEEKSCRLCGEPRAHTLRHYVLQCECLMQYRNSSVNHVTDQVIWMFSNDKVKEMIEKCQSIQKIIR